MKLFVTGQYEPHYNRNLVVLHGLRQTPGVELREYPYASKRKANRHTLREGFDWADAVFLPSFTHYDVAFVRRQTRKPLVFDPLISRYLTKVFDYKTVWPYSPRALKNWWKDWRSMRLADLVFADTEAHKAYFVSKFGVDAQKVHVLYIGVNRDDFAPQPEPAESAPFRVGFYGNFIPLQGTEYIVEAARLLAHHADIEFELIGDGFEYRRIRQLAQQHGLQRVHFVGKLPYHELAGRLAQYHVCLGIFGHTPKADLVIPNKVYHYAGLQKAFITKDTPAIRELFEHQKHALLCSPQPEAIAEAIVRLKNDGALRQHLATNAYRLIADTLDERAVAQNFLQAVGSLLAQRG